MCAVIAVPCFLFTLAAAPEIVEVVFGAKLLPSVPVMRVFCLAGALQSVMQFNESLLQSIGRARLVFWLAVAGTVLLVAGFAVSVQYGLVWVAWAYTIRTYLIAPVGFVIAYRALDGTVSDHVAGLLPPLLSTGIMVAATFALKEVLNPILPVGLALLLIAVGAGGIYLISLRTIGPAVFREARGYLSSAIRRRRSVTPAPA